MDHLKNFKLQKVSIQNNFKVWICETSQLSQRRDELYKTCLKLNKTLKCFYQCEDCIGVRNTIECVMDRLLIKVFTIFKIFLNYINIIHYILMINFY